MGKTAIIIGAGPAGLTAAYELLKRTDIKPAILEKSGDIGGISKTINYKGNRIDIGGHRFFSKSDRVMQWWLNILPLPADKDGELSISYHQQHKTFSKEDFPNTSNQPPDPEKVMLIRRRLSRIYFVRKFFSYPLQLSLETLRKLGIKRTFSILLSYVRSRLFPIKQEKSLEDFFINRFGKTLYLLFFKDYTEKVWGVPCKKISAEWGAQRIKGVSISKAIAHAIKTLKPSKDLAQKNTETSLIEHFLYPKYGPGQLWEEVASQVKQMGGTILLEHEVKDIFTAEGKITAIEAQHTPSGQKIMLPGDYFFSTMPVQELVAALHAPVPGDVKTVAEGLQYRDFITVGVLLKQLSNPEQKQADTQKTGLSDTWIYIQEKDVRVGRLQFFKNWSPYMVKDPGNAWLGMEYFCSKGDGFWELEDDRIRDQAIDELKQMGFARDEDVLDTTVIRMEKTYPAYFGTYDQFNLVRDYVDSFENIFLVGRNGMHKYNNSDHSMLTAMVAVDNIIAGITSKENIWAINTEQEYHEEKSAAQEPVAPLPTAPGFAPNFFQLIWRNKWNRAYCITAVVAWLVQFIILKLHYPFANYMPDSYSYLGAADSNADINIWPIAYSKFLRFISVFTHSDKILVGVQYFSMQCSTMIFLFTLIHFLKPGKLVKNALWLFIILNPLPLFVANYIAADALFIAGSLLWLTTLTWIIFRPSSWQIYIQAILLLACFTIRYNAIYYPLIMALAFIITRKNWKFKIAGIAAGLLLVACSYFYTSQKTKELTGKRQFSAFGGWQMANNALYMYEYIPNAQKKPVPARFAKLETMVRQHMDTMRKIKFTYEDTVAARFYLWSGRGPLVQFMSREWKKDSTSSYLTRWTSEGPYFLDYGKYLILQYPFAFLEHFMLPNAVKFAVPPIEFLAVYNMGEDSVRPLAKDWFQYKSLKVDTHHSKKPGNPFTEWYPIFSALVNLLFLVNIVGFSILIGFKNNKNLLRLLAIAGLFWLLNAGFSIFASPVTMRYQVFPVLVTFFLALLIGEVIYAPQKQSLKVNI